MQKAEWEYLAELLKADVAAYNKALSDLDTEIKALKDKNGTVKKGCYCQEERGQ